MQQVMLSQSLTNTQLRSQWVSRTLSHVTKGETPDLGVLAHSFWKMRSKFIAENDGPVVSGLWVWLK